MNLLDIINRACTRAKMPQLKTLEDSVNVQAREYLEYANQANEDIIHFWPWRALVKDCVVTTYANQQNLVLPDDFDGFMIDQIYDRTRNLWLQNADDDVSMENRAGRYMTDIPFWRVVGNKIVFDFPLEAGRELLITYKSNHAVFNQQNGLVELFSKDTDTYLLNTQALIAGILFEKSAAYNDSDLEMNRDKFFALLNSLKERDGAHRKINIFGRGYNRISPTNFQPYDEPV